jgi:hypothetical protein
MGRDQIFRTLPDVTLVQELLQTCWHLHGLKDTRQFSRDIISQEAMVTLVEKMRPFYLPCKARTYLSDMQPKRAITVLRHMLRLFGYKLISEETHVDKRKTILYHVEPEVRELHCEIDKDGLVLRFD